MWIGPTLASPDTFLPVPEVFQTVAIRDVTVQDDMVSGEIVNMSPRQLRDVQLLIRHVWHWKNEFQPGENAPGSAEYYTVEGEMASGESARFTYRLASQLPSRSDGHFETVVTVAGFATIEQEREARGRGRNRSPVS